MKRFLFLLVFTLSLGCFAGLKAEAVYSGGVFVKGTLGESTKFSLNLQIYGDGPCVVKGKTTYYSDEEVKSVIPVYGYWLNETSGEMRIYEVYNDKVCGTFTFIFEGDVDCSSTEGGQVPTEGQWALGDKIMPFNDVTCEVICPMLPEDEFMWYYNGQAEGASGIYAFNYIGKDDKRPIDKRRLLLLGTENDVTWTFELQKNRQYYSISATRALDDGNYTTWEPFRIGNADYSAKVLQDVILIIDCNPERVPDGKIPERFEIDGIYIKEYSLNKFETKLYPYGEPSPRSTEEDVVDDDGGGDANEIGE